MRIKINDSEGLIKQIRQSIAKGNYTNCYISDKMTEEKVNRAKVWKQEFDGGFYLFFQEENREDLYYFLKKGGVAPKICQGNLPIVLSTVYMEAKKRTPDETAWINIGFKPYLTRKRFFLQTKDISFSKREAKLADVDFVQEIYDLMTDSFEPYTSALISKEQVENEIQKGNILICAENKNLLGFLHFETEKTISTLWHIAVKKEARGKAIGEKLVRDWLYYQKDSATRFILWVRDDNMAALKMYEKIGFLPDGRIAPVMIKERD